MAKPKKKDKVKKMYWFLFSENKDEEEDFWGTTKYKYTVYGSGETEREAILEAVEHGGLQLVTGEREFSLARCTKKLFKHLEQFGGHNVSLVLDLDTEVYTLGYDEDEEEDE